LDKKELKMFLPKYLPHYTYEDYKNWEGKWELIDGIPYAMSPAHTPKHQIVSNNIAWQLKEILKDCKECKALLPVDWKISEDTVVQPDNLVICYPLDDKPYIAKSPTLIFEIVSKSSQEKDEKIKFDIYEKEGVKYYIIVYPDEKIAKVFELKIGKYTKLLDATDEAVDFRLKNCKVRFDFSKIWE
jgi:Uma2 family endonuclease